METSRDLVKGNPGETQAVLIQVSLNSIKRSWKRERREPGKVANVCNMSRAVAMNMHFWGKHLFLFPLVTAKLITNYFGKKRCGSNKIFLLIPRQFICAPNLRSGKSDAARTRKKSASSWFTLRIRSASPLTQENSMRHCIIVVKVIAYYFAGESGNGNTVQFWMTKRDVGKKWTSIATVPD